MAPLAPGAPRLLWTTDMLMDGVDFDSAKHAWRQVGWKAMAVNLSDCAAMAASPRSALCAVALNDRLSMEQALELAEGVRECGVRYGCPLVGGDTNSWDAPTVVAVSVVAESGPHGPIGRSGAKAGDLVCVSGRLGGSILGRHLAPTPRLDLAAGIAERLAPSAMIDISDGLAIDLSRILEASGVGAELSRAALENVIHADARRLAEESGKPALEHALRDGEDFELLACVPGGADPRQTEALGLIAIGRIIAEPGLWLGGGAEREPLSSAGWEHFR